MTVRAETTGVGLKFRGDAHFLIEARKKSRLHGRGCIFSRSPIVQAVAFWLVFGAVLIVPLATWSFHLRGPHLRIWRVLVRGGGVCAPPLCRHRPAPVG